MIGKLLHGFYCLDLWKAALVATVFTAMSTGIETLQYRFCLGRCENDDVIRNTAGALLGSIAVLRLPPILCVSERKSEA